MEAPLPTDMPKKRGKTGEKMEERFVLEILKWQIISNQKRIN